MGYPYDKRYLELINLSNHEPYDIKSAYLAFKKEYCEQHGVSDIDLSIIEEFTLLGKAFQYGSHTLDSCTDEYHFMDDVIEALLPYKPKKDK